MKTYEGTRTSEGGPQTVRVHEDGKPVRILAHQMRHSPDGFQWGYAGSGPADLARSILWDHLGRAVDPGVYQAFKFAFVANWGDQWQITSVQIAEWLDGRLETDD